MLDDIDVLRAAVRAYRAAATRAGLDWPDHPEMPAGPAPEQVGRIFGVDHVAEQLTWLYAQPWPDRQVLPNVGWRAPWPPEVDALDHLQMSVGTPFCWRHQLPLFHFDHFVYTFVLAGEHEGEVWRYEVPEELPGPVRAATSLAALFDQWIRGIEAGVIVYDPEVRWLLVEGQADGVDPVAIPFDLDEDLLRRRQRECGVDLAAVDEGFDRFEQMMDSVDAVKASLHE